MSVVAARTEAPAATLRGGLVWSEYGYLAAVAIAAAVTVDPLEWRLGSDPVVKHLALMVTLPAVALTLVGRRLRTAAARTARAATVVHATWPLLVLAALIICGSAYARLVGQEQNTFLNVGLYMAMTACAAAMARGTDAPEALLRGYFGILLVAAVVMSVRLVANFGVRQVYHEQIFLVIPMAALLVVKTPRGIARWIGCALFLSMAWFSHKYTAYLIGVLTVLYLALAVALPRLDRRPALQRIAAVYWCAFLGLVAAALFAYVAQQSPTGLPSGNPEYRMHTYAAAWGRFTDSPVWGTLFTAEAVERFSLYTIGVARNVLPTHSDLLDLLAHGGIIAAALLLLGLARAARLAWRTVLGRESLDHPGAPYAHTLALLTIAGIATCAFNPILLQPSMAYLLWSNLGVLIGLALRRDALPASGRHAPDAPGAGAGRRRRGPTPPLGTPIA
jgi:hypothetical protein